MLDVVAEFLKHIRDKFVIEKISLAGYSMGGRACLKIVEDLGNYIDKVVLMASDGLRFNWFYYLLTRTTAGKALFKDFINRPAKYMKYVSRARNLRLVDESRYKFAMQYLQTEEKRMFLYNVWPDMSMLIPEAKKVKNTLNKQGISLAIFMGKYDRIIPAALAQQFCKGLNKAELHIVDKGHRLMDEDTIKDIAKFLLA